LKVSINNWEYDRLLVFQQKLLSMEKVKQLIVHLTHKMHTYNILQIVINKVFETSHCFRKGKFVPYTSWKHTGGVKAYLYSVSTSVPDGGKCLTSLSGRFTP
jgi:hypothetical protein